MIRVPLACVLATLLAVGPAAAQQIRGQVVDSTGAPLAGETVMLHNVTASTGSLLAETRSDSAGHFAFEAESDVPDGSVYFAAVRRDGQLYIGAMLRAPLTTPTDYRIEVGPGGRVPELGPATGAPAGAAAPPPSGSDGTAYLLAIPFVIAAGLAAWLLLRRRGPPARRRLVRDIAELDEQHAAGAASPEAEAHYREQRAELFDQLRHETR